MKILKLYVTFLKIAFKIIYIMLQNKMEIKNKINNSTLIDSFLKQKNVICEYMVIKKL